MPEVHEELADRIYKALASRPRRQILLMLAGGAGAGDARCCGANDICACVFSERLGVSAATISHHMKVLQEAGLVSARKDAQWVHYTLRPEVIATLAEELRALGGCCCAAEEPAALPAALAGKRVAILGAGKVGRALGTLLASAGVEVAAVTARSLEHAEEAARAVGAGAVQPRAPRAGASPAATPRPQALTDNAAAARLGDLVLVTTGDDAIAPLVRELAEQGAFSPGQCVVHMSGALPLSALSPAADAGALIGCAHPLVSFASAEAAVRAIPGSYFGVTAGPGAEEILGALVDVLGGHAVAVPDDAKALYHAAAVVASNYLVAIEDLAVELMQSAGFGEAGALAALRPLMSGTLANVRSRGTTAALTGPVVRGDVDTVRKHLEALEDLPAGCADLYRALGLRALEIAARRGGMDAETLAELGELLRERAGSAGGPAS